MVDNKAALADKRTAFLEAQEAKRAKYLEAKKAYELYDFMGLSTRETPLPEAYSAIPAAFKEAHALYLKALVFAATEAVRGVVKDVEAFMYEDYYICVRLEGKKKFKQYIPPPGRGNGIYDAVNWEDFEMLLGETANESFINQGIEVDNVNVNGYYHEKGILLEENATPEETVGLDYYIFDSLLTPVMHRGIS